MKERIPRGRRPRLASSPCLAPPAMRGSREAQLELFADDDLTSLLPSGSLVAGRSPEATAGDVSALKPVKKGGPRSGQH